MTSCPRCGGNIIRGDPRYEQDTRCIQCGRPPETPISYTVEPTPQELLVLDIPREAHRRKAEQEARLTRLRAMVARGAPLDDAARELGVVRRTALRWLRKGL